MTFKVALLGIYHESNTFVDQPTTLDDFRKGHYMKGPSIREEYADAHHEIGGMIEVLDQYGIELVPVFYAEATPGGTITSETYQYLLNEMWEELDRILPIDACLVVPHGAGVSEAFPDMDGHWLSLLRQKLGSDTPIVGTLDLHANVSPAMTASTDALVSYRQNPHVDQRDRGREAALILVDMLKEKTRPTQALIQVPLSISIEQHFTQEEPCKQLYALSDKLRVHPGILSISILLGFPYADVKEMGTSFIVVADGDETLALETGNKLKDYLLTKKEEFVGTKINIPTALDQAIGNEKPVLMLDMGDNIGGGSPGNSLSLLKALEQFNKLVYFVCIYDPHAVSEAAKHAPGEVFELTISGTDSGEDEKFTLKTRLIRVKDGRFKEEQARHGGQVNYQMGLAAVVLTENGNTIMLTSLRVPPFSLQQLVSMDIDPNQFEVIIAKGVIAPIAAYAPVCRSLIQVDTPGVTQADMTKFHYINRRRPLFPFENIPEQGRLT